MHTLTMDKKKYVLVPVEEYRRLKRNQEQDAPPLPPADEQGNRPALAFAEAQIARSLVRDRKAVGLSQAELARRAGIRVETLNRAERGAVVPDVRTLTKIEKALLAAGLKRERAGR